MAHRPKNRRPRVRHGRRTPKIGLAFIAAALVSGPLAASPSHEVSGIASTVAAEAPMRLAVVIQRSIPVGDYRVNDRWKCTTATSAGVYLASGNTESRARAKLAPYASGHIACRMRPIMLFRGH